MCIKNVNTDVVFFVDAPTLNENEQAFFRICKDEPVVNAKKVNEEGNCSVLKIPQINFLLSINATEKTKDGKAIHSDKETKYNTLFFDYKYEIRLRITETASGRFVDLDTFVMKPQEEHIHLCRNIFSYRKTCQYNNILVATPPKGKNKCVLKVLIRCAPECGKDEGAWIVQSIHPIQLNIEE